MRHAAAVRLRAYEAPTVSTDRLRAAIQFFSPNMRRVWTSGIAAVAAGTHGVAIDTGLLRYAFLYAMMSAPLNYPATTDPRLLSTQLCDLLLGGLVVDCPHDEALDGSAASQAAGDAIAGWRKLDQDEPSGGRASIIDAARTEFARRGYEATTIRDIADSAGVSMGSLYRRLDSKESILLEILEIYSGRLDHAVGDVLATDSSEVELIDALARVFVRASRRFRKELEIVKLGWTGKEFSASPFHCYFLQTQQRLEVWERLVERGQNLGTLRQIGPPAEVAFHVRGVLWTPFQDLARSSEARAHRFIRQSVLRGSLVDR